MLTLEITAGISLITVIGWVIKLTRDITRLQVRQESTREEIRAFKDLNIGVKLAGIEKDIQYIKTLLEGSEK